MGRLINTAPTSSASHSHRIIDQLPIYEAAYAIRGEGCLSLLSVDDIIWPFGAGWLAVYRLTLHDTYQSLRLVKGTNKIISYWVPRIDILPRLIVSCPIRGEEYLSTPRTGHVGSYLIAPHDYTHQNALIHKFVSEGMYDKV